MYFIRIPHYYKTMQAIVSLLDKEHCSRLEGLWTDLKDTFGIQSKYTRFLPHFSYQVSDRYPPEKTRETLQEFVCSREPFQVSTAGLGVFTQPHLVIFLPVIRSAKLTLFHNQLWKKTCPDAESENDQYHPDKWVPHITLVYGENLLQEEMGTIINYLGQHIINWDITVDNIALIDDKVLDERTEMQFTFGQAVTKE